MKGSHHVSLETNKVKYDCDIKRNITVIQGDSATGKTTLASLIAQNVRYGKAAGISLQSDVPCITFDGSELWKERLKSYENTIIIIDEGNSFIFSKDFAEVIQQTSNYYVLITRKPLLNLPYSINEIYGIRTSDKYHYPEKIYHEFYPIYRGEKSSIASNPLKILITEDSKAGFQFYEKTLDDVRCISAEGNSKIIKKIVEYADKGEITVIADGAAFGAFVESIVEYSKLFNAALYFPESFEWMILKSGVIKTEGIEKILNSPEDYIESREYFSWERFFTNMLQTLTSGDSIKAYSKDSLKPFYYSGKNGESILEVIPDDIRAALVH